MMRNELIRDTVEIWQKRNSAVPGGKDVITATIFPLPYGAGVREFETPDGTVTIDASYHRVNPANETQHAVVRGPNTGGRIETSLTNGKGRSTSNSNVEVIIDLSRLTSQLKAMHVRDSSRGKGW